LVTNKIKEATMNSVQDAFKYNQARKNVIIGGMVILVCITALSCVSSYTIYKTRFGDMPFIFQQAPALFSVLVVGGAFVWPGIRIHAGVFIGDGAIDLSGGDGISGHCDADQSGHPFHDGKGHSIAFVSDGMDRLGGGDGLHRGAVDSPVHYTGRSGDSTGPSR